MFAYFKHTDDSVFCVKIEGTRWHECPSLRFSTRIQSTKKLLGMRKRGSIPAYYIHGLSLIKY